MRAGVFAVAAIDMRRAWRGVLAVAALFLLAGWTLHHGDGLVRTAAPRVAGRDAVVARVHAIDLQGLGDLISLPAGIAVRWEGLWNVPATGVYDLSLESRGRSSWKIDDHLVQEIATAGDGTSRDVWLASGFHHIDILYEPDPTAPRIGVAAAITGQPLAPLAPATLKPSSPTNPRLRSAGVALYHVLGWLLLAAVVVAIRRTIPALAAKWKQRPAIGDRQRTVLAWTALAFILMYGALLRVDAITDRFGPVTSPRWLSALQTRTVMRPDAVRPAGFTWPASPLYPHADGVPTHYMSDPYTYLKFAREMRAFYAASFREPVFPFATRIFLHLLDGQDVALSFTSTAFSVLAIWLTYILGAAVWSRPVGLAAALGLSLDYDAISITSAGWRDDAFVAAVVLCAYLTLRCWRAGRESPRVLRLGRVALDAVYANAILLGLFAGFAILVRLFAASFLGPGVVLLLLTMRASWRRRLTMASLVIITAALVAGPYFVNCWRVYGDPLYAFNVHGNIYRIAEGKQESNQGTAAYIINKAALRPLEMLDTVARGLTTYPFTNKWRGLDRWRSGLGWWASVAAIAGLALLAASAPGRVILFVMLTALVPFAFTWKVDPNWRFTAHVYPFLLIAAAVGASGIVWCVRAAVVPGRVRWPGGPVRWRTQVLTWTSIATVALLGSWLIALVLPAQVFAETLRAHEGALVTAGSHDQAFFGRGWSDPSGDGNVRVRVATTEGVLSIPLPAVDDYTVTLRADPFPRPLHDTPRRLPVIELVLNGTSIGTVPLGWNPERVGAYDILLPRTAVRRGENRLILRVQRTMTPGSPDAGPDQPGLTDGAAVALWYLSVHPPERKGSRP